MLVNVILGAVQTLLSAVVNVAIGLLQGAGKLSVWLVRRPLRMMLRYGWALVTLAPRLAWASGKLVLGLVVPRKKAKGAA